MRLEASPAAPYPDILVQDAHGISESMGSATPGKIILVRHGETEANRRRCFADSDEIPLTQTGCLQAEQLAVRLAAEFRPAALLSSAYLRARQTSEIIGRVLQITTEVVTGIHERNFGCLRGHSYERLGDLMTEEVFRDPARTRLWRPEGGESLEDVRARAVPVLDAVRARFPGRQVVVVCHGAVIRAICAHITGDWDETRVLANCEITVVDHTPEGWKEPETPLYPISGRTVTLS